MRSPAAAVYRSSHAARWPDDDAGTGPGALPCPGAHSPGYPAEEATMEDHRKLGRELGLFGTDPLIGAGLPYWLPAGAAVRHALEEYVRELERLGGDPHRDSP